MSGGFTIREARDDDRPYCIKFIEALQAWEQPMAHDRRLDQTVGSEFYDVLIERARTREGKVYIAEAEGRPIGWTVVYTGLQELYIEPHLQKYGYISELYVEPAWHGSGVGQALLAAGEAHLRTTGVKYALIGVLEGNGRAEAAYRKAGFAHYAHDMRKWF
jgi:GNAT superfamily N-acetyltransferase